jgi:hypothetical protein
MGIGVAGVVESHSRKRVARQGGELVLPCLPRQTHMGCPLSSAPGGVLFFLTLAAIVESRQQEPSGRFIKQSRHR